MCGRKESGGCQVGSTKRLQPAKPRSHFIPDNAPQHLKKKKKNKVRVREESFQTDFEILTFLNQFDLFVKDSKQQILRIFIYFEQLKKRIKF